MRARRWRLVVRRSSVGQRQWVYHSETARTRDVARAIRNFLMHYCGVGPQNVRILAPGETVRALNALYYARSRASKVGRRRTPTVRLARPASMADRKSVV